MDGRYTEPRRAIWATAELSWRDVTGEYHIPATIEDTSPSGACLRVPQPVTVGSKVRVKWHREQFTAVTKNCRTDGRDFLLGLRREPESDCSAPGSESRQPVTPVSLATLSENNNNRAVQQRASVSPAAPPDPALKQANALGELPRATPVKAAIQNAPVLSQLDSTSAVSQAWESARSGEFSSDARSRIESSPSDHERKLMQPKTLFPNFWRRPAKPDVPGKPISMEESVNKPNAASADDRPRANLLSYEDIYRAAGILSPGAGYGIHKIVEMLNNERIRDLAKDVKRASVLMALDAAGISSDDLLTDATRRQNALNSYESAQRKQLEEFETRKAQENTRIEEEMEKVRAHYAERIQQNLDQVAKEKEALRNWQMAMQHETQRISEVLEMCGKQPAATPGQPLASAARAGAESGSNPADTVRPLRPTLLGGN